MLDFIWTLPVQLWGTRNKWTLQKILIHGRIRTTNSGTFCFPACTSNPSATETVDDLILELLQYLLTLRYYKNSVPCAKGYRENENKIIADLQFGDWYHLHTRWLTQKKTFILSYVSMTIYNIYSFLLIIVYIFCIIILTAGLAAFKWNQAWHSSEFICAERERGLVVNGATRNAQCATDNLSVILWAFGTQGKETTISFWEGAFKFCLGR